MIAVKVNLDQAQLDLVKSKMRGATGLENITDSSFEKAACGYRKKKSSRFVRSQ